MGYIASMDQDKTSPVFAVRITPHRSLSRHHFRLLMLLLVAGSAFASIPFLVMGFWPVAGFYGLDLLLLYLAFRWNYKDAQRYEDLRLFENAITLARIVPGKEQKQWLFNPFWTKLVTKDDDEFGVQELALVSGAKRIPFAQDLSPEERKSLSDAFGQALARVKKRI